MPTHFAYLTRITPAYWRFEPVSRYLRSQFAKKNAVCSRVRSSKAAFGRVNVTKFGFIAAIGRSR